MMNAQIKQDFHTEYLRHHAAMEIKFNGKTQKYSFLTSLVKIKTMVSKMKPLNKRK